MCGPSALDNPCPFIFIPYTGTGMGDGRMRWERRCREYPRGARTCSPKCAVKILDTILPFVLRDLGINLCRLRRTKKNASPHVTRARAFAPVWMKLLTLAWTCTCVGTPKAFHLFFYPPPFSPSLCHPLPDWNTEPTPFLPLLPPFSIRCSVDKS